jgi:hypothetical protein
VRTAAALVAALVLAACAGDPATPPRTSDRAQQLDGPPPPLTPTWGYMVYVNGSGTGGNVTIDSASKRQTFLSNVNAVVAQKCPGNPGACSVEISVWVCDLAHPPCSSETIVAASSWVYLIDTWSAAQQAQIAFLEQQNVPAHWVQSALQKHRDYQAFLLDQANAAVKAVEDARDALVQDVHDRIAAMGGQVTSEEQVRLANTRWAIRDLDQTTRRYQAALDGVRPLYADVVARYNAYRNGEPTTIGDLQGLIDAASDATLDDMAALKMSLAAVSDAENHDPQQLILDANRVRWELAHAQTEYEQGIARHAALIDEHGWPRLDHATVPRQGMGGIVGYAEERLDRVNTAVREILDGIQRREQALLLVAADQATRDQVHAAVAAETEADFLDEITRRTTELWKTPPSTPTLKLQLLGERVRTMQAFLQLEALCADPTNATWRAPGCQRVANELTKVKKYLGQQLPFAVRYAIPKLRTAGADEASLAEIDADLTAGRTAAAVHRYDAVVRALEEG